VGVDGQVSAFFSCFGVTDIRFGFWNRRWYGRLEFGFSVGNWVLEGMRDRLDRK
jgi:hypothetical protein